jgi:N utilization substance protein B
MKRQDIREHVFRLLFRTEFYAGADMEDQLNLYFEALPEDDDRIDTDFTEADMDYIRDKFSRITDCLGVIDQKLDRAAKGWDITRMGKVELAVLRLAVYEALYDDDIPVGVAIDQAVELSKKYGQEESSSFVNGILGNIAGKAGKEA